MLSALAPIVREAVLEPMVYFHWHIPEIGLLELAIVHPGISLQGIGSAAAFVHTHIELASCQGAFDPAEENGDFERFHLRRHRDKLIGIIAGVKIQEMVLLRIDFTALVQLTAGNSDIIVLGSLG